MDIALIGLLGVLIGIILNEQLRRKNRIENYSTIVFEKRLVLYEELHRLICLYSDIATEVIENEELSQEERHSLVSDVIFKVAEFSDENELYLNDEITLHCVPILMGVEDIQDIEDEAEKKKAIEKFKNNIHLAKKMIRKETGIADIDKLFTSIVKPKHTSPAIEYYKKLKKERGVKDKWE